MFPETSRNSAFFRGLGLLTWANLLECYTVGDRTKTVWGFDNWEGFTQLLPEDSAEVENCQKNVGGFSPEQYFEELENAIDIYDLDKFIPWEKHIKLVQGNIEETVPVFIDENPGVRFSLIHFDCDLYAPTKVALESFWDRLCRGGIMIFDEYSIAEWAGETLAVDEFFKDKPEIQVRTLPWTNSPAGYVIKK